MRSWAACYMAPWAYACWISVAAPASLPPACTASPVWVRGVRGSRAGGVWVPSPDSQSLSAPDLEQLHLGLYGMSDRLTLAKEGSPLLTHKWCHSLRELDVSGQGFSEKDLEQAFAAFSDPTSVGPQPALCYLNLRGTRVNPSTVRSASLLSPVGPFPSSGEPRAALLMPCPWPIAL